MAGGNLGERAPGLFGACMSGMINLVARGVRCVRQLERLLSSPVGYVTDIPLSVGREFFFGWCTWRKLGSFTKGRGSHDDGYPLQGSKRTPRSERKLRTTPWTTWRDKFNEGGPFLGQPFATRIGRGVSEGRRAFRVFDLFANAAGARGHP